MDAQAYGTLGAKAYGWCFTASTPAFPSAHQGYRFANGSSRFWKVVHQAGFTERQLAPEQWQQLQDTGCGITALVARADGSRR